MVHFGGNPAEEVPEPPDHAQNLTGTSPIELDAKSLILRGYDVLTTHRPTETLGLDLNALDGSITNNMAIVPNIDGKTDTCASGITQLILDISSYFAP